MAFRNKDGTQSFQGMFRGRPPGGYEEPPPTEYDFMPGSTDFVVTGRGSVIDWNMRNRKAFRWLTFFAKEFGLTVQEFSPVVPGGRGRKNWTHVRISLDDLHTDIITQPGILFDDWCRAYLPDGIASTPGARDAARRKAAVALSRLVKDDKVTKRYSNVDGRLMIYPYGNVPADAAVMKPRSLRARTAIVEAEIDREEK